MLLMLSINIKKVANLSKDHLTKGQSRTKKTKKKEKTNWKVIMETKLRKVAKKTKNKMLENQKVDRVAKEALKQVQWPQNQYIM
jgi:hypothetical protein